MQTYAPRDPVAEYMRGQISLRKLRVMVEHLPPGNAAARVVSPWSDVENLLHDIDSQLRALRALTYNIHRGKDQLAEQPDFIPKPPTRQQREADQRAAEQHARERAELLTTIARTSRSTNMR